MADMDPSSVLQRQNKIVCGFGNEVNRLRSHEHSFELQSECHLIGYVLAALMVFTLVYVLLAKMWAAYVDPCICVVHELIGDRFLAEEGTIRLEGDEKALLAERDAERAEQVEEYDDETVDGDAP